ncbi:UDP-glucose dehydrogenase family protein [Candidatus Spongiisocius sp.]|uniref:UDP-glucose dehydrogenase family protein n=1 Tax=Candidatus Spongiisocius sp. TaxID=3101273 RepID=UPI003B599E80
MSRTGPDDGAARAGSFSRMRIGVIGAGYVGLVQAGGLARLGHEVRVGERDEARLDALRSGRVPVYEPGLAALISEGRAMGRLSFHASNRKTVNGASVVFIALPTPSDDAGAVDTSILDGAIADVAPSLPAGSVLVIKSTVPVGTGRRISLMPAVAERDVRVVSNPEFLREGSAVEDFLNPDRIVIGSTDLHAAEILASGVYRDLPGERVVVDPASAEMIKYAANAYLATRVSFVNSIANLCETLGADAAAVLGGMGRDHRIGSHYLAPGPGYGGSCLPKDTRALEAMAECHGYEFRLLRAVMEVNEEQRDRIVGKVASAVGGKLSRATVGLWGLAFKAGTDDVRESPAADLARSLTSAGAAVRAYDPRAVLSMPGMEMAPDPLSAADGADVLLVATEWRQFRQVSPVALREAMRGSVVVDARNLLDAEAIRAAGLSYRGVGTGQP